MWLDKYLSANYLDGGRELPDIDCWGLVRLARHELGWLLLPSFGNVRHTMPRQFTEACREQAELMELCQPEPGAVAAVFRGQVCIHVGLVIEIDGRLAVLEINPKIGCRWIRVADFEKAYPRVTYHRDKNLSEQAGR